MRALVLDIETRPHLAHVWALWDQNVGLSQIVETGSVICFAAKWLDSKRTLFYSDHHDGHAAMVEAAWALIDEADAVVHYNGRAFDMKHLAREFVVAGLTPPSPHVDVDLYSAVRSRFKFASNKLDHVAQELGLGGKADTGGFDLWLGCMADKPEAWAKMRRYNKRDVLLTEQLYHRLLPWLRGHPNVALHNGKSGGCPRCGSADVMRRGSLVTSAGRYWRYQCRTCGAYSRGAMRIDTTALRPVS